MSKSKIDKASVATDKIFDHVGNALNGLNEQFEGRVVNGYGIHREPERARLAVKAAMDELRKAEALFAATDWPTSADYDE